MRRPLKITFGILGFLLLIALGIGGYLGYRYYSWKQVALSGGPLRPAQAAYDVKHYDLAVAIKPSDKTIQGSNTIAVQVLQPLNTFEVQLDGHLQVNSVYVDGKRADFSHHDGLIQVPLASAWQPGSRHAVKIAYGGKPYIAPMPPWYDGLVWSETPAGKPWVSVTSENSGGDIWWPCKDSPSDEPDEGMDIALTVPAGLVGLSNGRKMGETRNQDGTTTSHWTVHYPINNYDVTFYAAPYVRIDAPYHGVDGDKHETISFWALPAHVEQARKLWHREGAKIIRVLGKRFGEYPFLNDKYWVAEAPYLGMEHQSIIAYGAKFHDNAYGFDSLLLHETAHEWWGNKVTARDWADYWLHEAFASYSEAVYVNDTLGRGKYLQYIHNTCSKVRNDVPIVQGDNLTAEDAYVPDIYSKGACMLNTLRWLIGDRDFFHALRGFQDRYAYRLTSTEDFTAMVEQTANRKLDWFWQRYLFKAAAPVLSVTRSPHGKTDSVTLQWNDPEFPMPLPVSVNGELRRVPMPGGKASFDVPSDAKLKIDPEGWVMKAREKPPE